MKASSCAASTGTMRTNKTGEYDHEAGEDDQRRNQAAHAASRKPLGQRIEQVSKCGPDHKRQKNVMQQPQQADENQEGGHPEYNMPLKPMMLLEPHGTHLSARPRPSSCGGAIRRDRRRSRARSRWRPARATLVDARAASKPKPRSANTRWRAKSAPRYSLSRPAAADRHRLSHHPGQHEAGDDHDVARNDQDDQRDRQRAGDAERDVDRHNQRFVGQRIDVGAEFAGHMEALGEKAVHGVADPGHHETGKKQRAFRRT